MSLEARKYHPDAFRYTSPALGQDKDSDTSLERSVTAAPFNMEDLAYADQVARSNREKRASETIKITDSELLRRMETIINAGDVDEQMYETVPTTVLENLYTKILDRVQTLNNALRALGKNSSRESIDTIRREQGKFRVEALALAKVLDKRATLLAKPDKTDKPPHPVQEKTVDRRASLAE